jgi:hypothetical protein
MRKEGQELWKKYEEPEKANHEQLAQWYRFLPAILRNSDF